MHNTGSPHTGSDYGTQISSVLVPPISHLLARPEIVNLLGTKTTIIAPHRKKAVSIAFIGHAFLSLLEGAGSGGRGGIDRNGDYLRVDGQGEGCKEG